MQKIKQWILNLKFVKEDREQVYRDAFKHASADLKETNIYDTEERAKVLANQMLNSMCSNFDVTQIVTMDKQKGMVFIGGERAEEATLINLKNEADYISTTNLWRILYETPKELAQKTMFVSGETLADMQKGKSILYTLSTQKNIIELFKSYQLKK